MNLPDLSPLRNDSSTYISFQKALLDYDMSIANNSACYYSKVVALNLPVWTSLSFYLNLGIVGVQPDASPNIVFPKAIQYYMENICRQSIGINGTPIEEITELAFWKMLNKMGLSSEDIQENIVTFENTLALTNFVKVENNNGWCELIAQIPNKCKKLTPVWRTVESVSTMVQTNDSDIALYDNGNKQFIFSDEQKKVLDFDNCILDDVIDDEFNFNCLLLFYKDSAGINKLHGINFIYPFENKVTHWELETFTQKTNSVRSIGYQFIFNMKTNNNQASMLQVYEQNEQPFYNLFGETLGAFNSFLESKVIESPIM